MELVLDFKSVKSNMLHVLNDNKLSDNSLNYRHFIQYELKQAKNMKDLDYQFNDLIEQQNALSLSKSNIYNDLNCILNDWANILDK